MPCALFYNFIFGIWARVTHSFGCHLCFALRFGGGGGGRTIGLQHGGVIDTDI